jgi:3',5'-cyclic AMP phosphodiesterase CpdA
MRIAHVTDLHLLEHDHHRRTTAGRARLVFLGLGRTVDAFDRYDRALYAIRGALARNPDHLLVTGDLTEDGDDAQFAVLADVLREAGADPATTTLVAGNHDAYTRIDAFERALGGALRAYARTSTPGTVVVRGDVAIAAVSTVMQQPLVRSAGVITRNQVAALEAAIVDAPAERTWVLAMHHGPWSEHFLLGTWIDGLLGQEHLVGLFSRCDNAFAVHGHTHKCATTAIARGRFPQILCAEAVVESAAPVRLYLAGAGMLIPCSEPATQTRLSVVPAAA